MELKERTTHTVISKKKQKIVPLQEKLKLDHVYGITLTSNSSIAIDTVNGNVAYFAGCVVVLYNLKRNKQQHIFNTSKKPLTCLDFSNDGNYLVTGESGHLPMVRVWSTTEMTELVAFEGHTFGISCVAFSPSLKYVVSIGYQHDMSINVWDWKNDLKVASNKVACKVSDLSFSEDGDMFVTVGNRHVKFWYLSSSKSKIKTETLPLQGRNGILGDLQNNLFCSVACGVGVCKNNVYAVTDSGKLCVFNENRMLNKSVMLKTTKAFGMAVSETHVFIGCAKGVVRVFSAKSLQYITTLPTPSPLGSDVVLDPLFTLPNRGQGDGETRWADTVAVKLHNNKLVCVYNDHSMYVWEISDLLRVKKNRSLNFHSGAVWGLDILPENCPLGNLVTCANDDTIRFWSCNNLSKKNQSPFSPTKVLYTDASFSNLLDVEFNPAGKTDKADTTYQERNGIRCVSTHPTNMHLASGDRVGNVRVFDLKSMTQLHLIEAHDSEILCLDYFCSSSYANLMASGGRDRLIHIYDVQQDYKVIQTLDDHSAAVSSLKFVAVDLQLLLLSCSGDKSLLVRTASLDGSLNLQLSKNVASRCTLNDMQIDLTGKFVAVGCQDRNVRIYNTRTGKLKKSYNGSAGTEGGIIKVHLDPSSTYLATLTADKHVAMFDFFTGECVAHATSHSEQPTGVRFTNNAKNLVTSGADGCVFVWRLSGCLVENIKRRRQLKMEKDVDAVRTQPYEETPKMKKPIDRKLERLADDNNLVFEFSPGQLPAWAKSKFEGGQQKDSNESSRVPEDMRSLKGRWAEKMMEKRRLPLPPSFFGQSADDLNSNFQQQFQHQNDEKDGKVVEEEEDDEEEDDEFSSPTLQNTTLTLNGDMEDCTDDDDDEDDEDMADDEEEDAGTYLPNNTLGSSQLDLYEIEETKLNTPDTQTDEDSTPPSPSITHTPPIQPSFLDESFDTTMNRLENQLNRNSAVAPSNPHRCSISSKHFNVDKHLFQNDQGTKEKPSKPTQTKKSNVTFNDIKNNSNNNCNYGSLKRHTRSFGGAAIPGWARQKQQPQHNETNNNFKKSSSISTSTLSLQSDGASKKLNRQYSYRQSTESSHAKAVKTNDNKIAKKNYQSASNTGFNNSSSSSSGGINVNNCINYNNNNGHNNRGVDNFNHIDNNVNNININNTNNNNINKTNQKYNENNYNNDKSTTKQHNNNNINNNNNNNNNVSNLVNPSICHSTPDIYNIPISSATNQKHLQVYHDQSQKTKLKTNIPYRALSAQGDLITDDMVLSSDSVVSVVEVENNKNNNWKNNNKNNNLRNDDDNKSNNNSRNNENNNLRKDENKNNRWENNDNSLGNDKKNNRNSNTWARIRSESIRSSSYGSRNSVDKNTSYEGRHLEINNRNNYRKHSFDTIRNSSNSLHEATRVSKLKSRMGISNIKPFKKHHLSTTNICIEEDVSLDRSLNAREFSSEVESISTLHISPRLQRPHSSTPSDSVSPRDYFTSPPIRLPWWQRTHKRYNNDNNYNNNHDGDGVLRPTAVSSEHCLDVPTRAVKSSSSCITFKDIWATAPKEGEPQQISSQGTMRQNSSELYKKTKEKLKTILEEILEKYETSLKEGYDDGGELETCLHTALEEVRKRRSMYHKRL